MKWSTEAKVGIFTFMGIILFAIIILYLSKMVLFGKAGYEVIGIFQQVNGLTQGNIIRYAGVEAGRVDNVVARDENVEVRMRIYEGIQVPLDSYFSIETEGFLGERFVNIVPGDPTKGILRSGVTVYGSPPGGVDEALRQAKQLMATAQITVDSVNNVLGSPATQDALRRTIINAEAISGDMILLTANVQALAVQIQLMLDRLDGDGQATENIRQILANLNETSENAKNVSKRVKKWSLMSTKVTGNAEILYNVDKREYDINANAQIGNKEQYGIFGAENIGNNSKINIQYGRNRGNFSGRVGIIRGEPGIGIDYAKSDRWNISIDAYDFNDTELRVRGEWKIMPNVYVVGQTIHPRKNNHGGEYFGINHTF